jgi:hypothetical protein
LAGANCVGRHWHPTKAVLLHLNPNVRIAEISSNVANIGIPLKHLTKAILIHQLIKAVAEEVFKDNSRILRNH